MCPTIWPRTPRRAGAATANLIERRTTRPLPHRGLTPEERRRLLAYVDTVKAALRSAPTCPALPAQSKSLCAHLRFPSLSTSRSRSRRARCSQYQPPVQPSATDGSWETRRARSSSTRPAPARSSATAGSGGETRLVAEDPQHPAPIPRLRELLQSSLDGDSERTVMRVAVGDKGVIRPVALHERECGTNRTPD